MSELFGTAKNFPQLLRLETVGRDPQTVADEVLAELRRRGMLPE